MNKKERLKTAMNLIRGAQLEIREASPETWDKLEEAWGWIDLELFKIGQIKR